MMAACGEALESGSSIMIFPEGTRSLDGELREFKHGAFTLALRHHVPILPIVLDGTLDALPKHGVTSPGADIVIQVLDPIPVDGFSDVDALRDHVRGVMADALRACARASRRAGVPPRDVPLASGTRSDVALRVAMRARAALGRCMRQRRTIHQDVAVARAAAREAARGGAERLTDAELLASCFRPPARGRRTPSTRRARGCSVRLAASARRRAARGPARDPGIGAARAAMMQASASWRGATRSSVSARHAASHQRGGLSPLWRAARRAPEGAVPRDPARR
jgi:hypothetical protein